MPEQTGQAAFTEVLQLGVDTQGFAQQMDQVVQIYKDALAKMPDLDKVSGTVFADQLAKLNDSVSQLAKGVGEALGDVGATMTETAGVIETQMGAAAKAVQESQALIVEALNKVRTKQSETKESTGVLGDIISGLTDDFAKASAGILRSVLVFDSINAVLRTTGELITAPFKAIAEGFTYLQNVQERASEVKAALLQSVQYSGDWGENVEVAGKQADLLVEKIDNIATKLKVNSQAVQTGFTSFLEYGGRNLVGSVDDALNLSALVTGALQTQTPNLESRKLISEIQKLVQGAAGDTDKLAAALGLSKDQLRQMVENAQKYHDLYQEILALAPGIADRIADANNRQLSLIATLDLYKERWEALIAGPLFQQFTKILQDILAWVDQNSEKINNVAINLGIAIGVAADKAKEFLSGNWKGVAEDLGTVAGIFGTIAIAIADIANHLVQIYQTARAVSSFGWNKEESAQAQQGASLMQKAFEQTGDSRFLSYAQGAEAQAADKNATAQAAKERGEDANKLANSADKAFDRLNDIFLKMASGDFSALKSLTQGPAGKSSGDQPLANGSAINSISFKQEPGIALRADTQEYRDQITKARAFYQAQTDIVQESLAKNEINHQQAAAKIKVFAQQEVQSVETITKAYQKLAAESGAKPEAIQAAQANMQKSLDELKAQTAHSVSAAQKAANAETEAEAKAHYQTLYALEAQNQKDRLTLVRQAAADGHLTQVQAFDQETAILGEEYLAQKENVQNEIDAANQNVLQREAATRKMMLLDDQFTASTQARVQQRISLIEREKAAQAQFNQSMEQAAINRQGIISGASDLAPSAQYEAAQRQLALETALTEQAIKSTAALLAESEAKNKNSEATRRLTEQLAGQQNARLQQFGQTLQQSASRAGSNVGLAQVFAAGTAQTEITKLNQQLNTLTQALKDSQNKLQTDIGKGDTGAVNKDQLDIGELAKQIDATTESLHGMQSIADSLGLSFGKVSQSLADTLLGPNFASTMESLITNFKNADGGLEKLQDGFSIAGEGLQGLTNIGKAISGTINQYSQGKKEGGVLGGVGSLLSSGPVSDALSLVPVVGPIIKPLGEAFSFIGGLFVAEAKRIAASIEKNIKAINDAYSQGTETLAQTISDLQKQRQDAVSRLSGVKGGKDQLDKILPDLDNEIASLQQQANSIKKSFEDTIIQLQAGGTELQQWTKTWQDINKQVLDYLAAGGDIAKANQYLNDQLQQQRQDIIDNLDQGQSQAIQDAINLNNLIQQRIDLIKQEQETEFGIMNQNAIEKRTSTGVQVASQLAQQRQSYNQQLEDLDNQVTATQQKVSLEKQIFDIASDTASLQAQANALNLQTLQEQLTIYQQMQQIIASTSGLTFSGTTYNPVVPGTGTSGAGAVSGIPAINLTVNVDASGQDVNSQQFAGHLASAIQSQVTANRTSI